MIINIKSIKVSIVYLLLSVSLFGQTVPNKIIQKEIVPIVCDVTVNPVSFQLPSSSTTQTVNVTTTGIRCLWSISTNNSWITLSSISGSGTGSFTFTTTANTGSISRTGTILIQVGDLLNDIVINQAGSLAPPSTPGSISGLSQVCSGSAQTYSISAVTGATSYNWLVPSGSIIRSGQGTTSIDVTIGNTAGNISVRAQNAAGNSAYSNKSILLNLTPAISTQPVNKTVCSGSSASFSVTASGTGISYQWRKNGTNISGATSATYSISSVSTSHAGTYTCLVTGTCGNVTSSSATLTVKTSPIITKQPINQDVCPLDDAIFSVTASGTAPLSYQWLRNGEIEIVGATTASYSIESVKIFMTGTYKCVVANTCGSATSNEATLSIKPLPTITTQPVNKTTCSGTSVSLSLVASNATGYQWRKSGVAITGATSASYTIPSPTTGNAGSYECVVTNGCGSVTSNTVTLTVNTPPTITTQPVNKTTCSGTSVTLSLAATNATSYQWRKSGVAISGATSASYTIPSPTTGNAGSYNCVVTNGCGSVTSNTVTLTVNIATLISVQPVNTNVCAGSSASLSVTASGTGLSYQWSKNGTNISGANSATYSISSASSSHAGTYSCLITGTCGSITSGPANLTVYTAPTISAQPVNKTVCAGSSASLSVTASGTGISYQWRKDGANISGATSATHTISSASSSHAGTYSCLVTGTCGSITSSTATLTVNIAPSISVQPVNTNVCEGSSASLSVTASGTGLSYQWSKNGTNITGANSATYSISSASSSSHAGTYSCLITGTCGSITSGPANLAVNTVTSISVQPVNTNVCAGSSASLSVTASGTGISYQWRKDGANISGATSSTYTISSASSSHAGNYNCLVTGTCGNVTSVSALLIVNSNPSFIRTETALTSVKTETDLDALNEDQKRTTFSYFDGLGRSIQSVTVKSSPMKNDIVQFIEFDEMGRQKREYLPYSVSSQNGAYREEATTEQRNFHFAFPEIANSAYPYSEKVFENSPLNRVLEQGAPGADWQPYSSAIPNSGHTVKANYLTNTFADNVIIWKIDDNGNCTNIGTYGVGKLFKNELIDENENSILEFTDLSGKTILKKIFNTIYNDNGSVLQEQEICTYYIYDDFERLRYVLPPNAVDAIGTSSFTYTDFSELIYYYKYDEKGRMVEKKIPGAGKVLMVYDKRDRLVLTQDGNLSSGNNWIFTKYDILNRPIYTGVITITRAEADIRDDFNNTTYGFYETKTTTGLGYTLTNSFPATYYTITENNILSVNYYDDYSFLSLPGFSGMAFDNTSNSIDDNPDNIDGFSNGYSNWTIGHAIGSMIKVLDGAEYTASAKKKYSVNYYDDKLRVIQAIEKGYDNSENFISNKYSFAGLLLKTRQIHTAYSKEYVVDKELVYDHAGRLLQVWQTVSGAITKPKILMAEMQYNELGKMIVKKLHQGLQDVDFTYNVRGWLTAINNPNNLGPDLFGMKLLYNDVSEKGVLDGEAQYNGNIGGMIWNSKSIETEPVRGYGFTYDKLNRLTAADYGEYASGWTDFADKYNVPKISYDKAGNILSLKRYGSSGIIDDLNYGYNNSNKSNKLNFVNDLDTTVGFANGGSGINEYSYDVNGNLTKDDNKGLSNIQYNILNLPKSITKGSNSITYIYDAAGTKLVNLLPNSKAYKYLCNFVYNETNTLEYIITDEGRLYVDGTSAKYEYYLKDHLGNTRVVFDETGATPVQTNHYYPFGMRFNNASTGSALNKYLYNGKELQEETDWLDYGARFYDPANPIFTTIDPKAEERYSLSPYNYCSLNPINRVDPDGMLDTRYEDEEGNELLTTNDGSDAVVTVSNDKLDTFKENIEASSSPGMKAVYDSKGWNNYWKYELLGFELSDKQESVLSSLNSNWSRKAAIQYWKTGEIADGASFAFKEALSQWTNPELVVTGVAAGVAGYGAVSRSTVYRVYGGDAEASGYSWTPKNPARVGNFRDAAGLPSGGASGANNTGRFLIKGTVNNSDIIKTRAAVPLDGNKGGLMEYIIDPINVTIRRVLGINPEL